MRIISCYASGGRMRSDRKVSCGNCGTSRSGASPGITRGSLTGSACRNIPACSHFNLPLCSKKCKREYLAKIEKDRERSRHWFVTCAASVSVRRATRGQHGVRGAKVNSRTLDQRSTPCRFRLAQQLQISSRGVCSQRPEGFHHGSRRWTGKL